MGGQQNTALLRLLASSWGAALRLGRGICGILFDNRLPGLDPALVGTFLAAELLFVTGIKLAHLGKERRRIFRGGGFVSISAFGLGIHFLEQIGDMRVFERLFLELEIAGVSRG